MSDHIIGKRKGFLDRLCNAWVQSNHPEIYAQMKVLADNRYGPAPEVKRVPSMAELVKDMK